MKLFLSRLISFGFAILLAWGSLGITISTHTCGGKVVKTKWGISAADVDCGMAKKRSKCPKHQAKKQNNTHQLGNGCCVNSFDQIKIGNEIEDEEPASISAPEIAVLASTFSKETWSENGESPVTDTRFRFRRSNQKIYILIESFLV